jgi:hypothetical protein
MTSDNVREYLIYLKHNKRFARCREFFRIARLETKKGARTCVQIIKELTGFDPLKCPVCKVGTLITIPLVPKLPPGMALAASAALPQQHKIP